MPLYDIHCEHCGQDAEVLVSTADATLHCPSCQSQQVTRLLSAPSAMTGRTAQSLPGPGDTSCCGSSPSEAGCAGPGSCCGKTF